MKILDLLKVQCVLNNNLLSIEDLLTLNKVVSYVKERNVDCLSLDDLNYLFEDEDKNLEFDFSSNEDDEIFAFANDDVTDDAIELLLEISNTHQRTYTPLEHKLIETGVISGRCYISWNTNTYYPGATVDNLKTMGFDKFYDTYKNNWEKIKEFRRGLYSSLRRN